MPLQFIAGGMQYLRHVPCPWAEIAHAQPEAGKAGCLIQWMSAPKDKSRPKGLASIPTTGLSKGWDFKLFALFPDCQSHQ